MFCVCMCVFILPVSHSSLLSINPTVRIILPHCFHLHFKCFYKCVKRLIHYVGMTSNENIVMYFSVLVYMVIFVEMNEHEPCIYEKLPSNKFSIFALCFEKVFFCCIFPHRSLVSRPFTLWSLLCQLILANGLSFDVGSTLN